MVVLTDAAGGTLVKMASIDRLHTPKAGSFRVHSEENGEGSGLIDGMTSG
jgi:hypothetical protein